MEQAEKDLLKKEISMIIKIDQKYDLSDAQNARKIYILVKQKNMFKTPAGTRFMNRLARYAVGNDVDDKCIFCGKRTGKKKLVCDTCVSRFSNTYKPQTEQNNAANQVNHIANKTVAITKNVIDETGKATLIAKKKILEQVHDENNQRMVKESADKAKSILRRIWDKYRKLSTRNQIIIGITFLFLVMGMMSNIGVVGGNTKIADEEKAQTVVIKEFSEDEGWSVSFGGTKNMTIGSMDTPIGKSTDYQQKQVEATQNSELIQAYYSEQVTCWTFKVHKNGPNMVQSGVVTVTPDGKMFCQGIFEDFPSAELNFRIK